MNTHTLNLDQVVAVINACGALVAQLDAHQVGGLLFVCCLLLGTIAVMCLTIPPR